MIRSRRIRPGSNRDSSFLVRSRRRGVVSRSESRRSAGSPFGRISHDFAIRVSEDARVSAARSLREILIDWARSVWTRFLSIERLERWYGSAVDHAFAQFRGGRGVASERHLRFLLLRLLSGRRAPPAPRARGGEPTPRPWVNFSSFAALAASARPRCASGTTKLLVCGWYFVSEKFSRREKLSLGVVRQTRGVLFSCRRKWSKSAPPIPRLCAFVPASGRSSTSRARSRCSNRCFSS